MDCVFCEIINKKISSDIIFENENIIAFKDVSPAAPVHILVVPKIHIKNINEINSQNVCFISYIFEEIPKIAKKLGVFDYRIINNCGKFAGQTVNHLHFHLIGGKKLSWTPD